MDDPIIDLSLIPTYLITKEIKNIVLVLGGDGGDELFGGYDHYSRLNVKISKFNKFLPKVYRDNF